MKTLLFAAILSLAAVPAFAGPTEDATAHSKAFEKAANARDAKAMLALYEPDAHVVWPGQGEEANGTAEIEKLIAKFLKDLPKDAKISLKSQKAVPLGNGQVATVGHWQETFTDADGKKQSADIRTTEIIKREKDKTLYVVDHASIGTPPEPASAAEKHATK
jgi:uncharacterized protein (TIGR02246 family)